MDPDNSEARTCLKIKWEQCCAWMYQEFASGLSQAPEPKDRLTGVTEYVNVSRVAEHIRRNHSVLVPMLAF